MTAFNDSKKLRFSIVITTYNRIPSLQACMDALVPQLEDTGGAEVIIANDGGERRRFDDLRLRGSRIPTRIFHLEHKGPAAARNFCIKESRGDIVIFLDDDSLPAKDWFAATVRAWEEFGDAEGIGGSVISDDLDTICSKVNADLFNWFLRKSSAKGYATFLVTCNAGYRKDLLDRVGGFDEHFKDAAGEDRDINLSIAKLGGRLKLDERIRVYHDRQLGFWRFVRKHFNYGRAAYKLYSKHSELRPPPLRSHIDFCLAILGYHNKFSEKFMVGLVFVASQIATSAGHIKAMACQREARSC